MKKLLFSCVIFLSSFVLQAHDMRENALPPRHWSVGDGGVDLVGYFSLYKDGRVYVQKEDGALVNYALSEFNSDDRDFVLHRYKKVEALNTHPIKSDVSKESPLTWSLLLGALVLALLGSGVFLSKTKLNSPVGRVSFFSACIIFLSGFTARVVDTTTTTTDPSTVDAAFQPFVPNVHTSWDDTYFYVESYGIPEHQMMVGITAWQQQVPIPQCYTGANAWSIPLNPVIAATPVPVNAQHFLRGAVAIAVNGVAIFNPLTNTGVDALVDGQLDNWGGHCGRADDYHYHVAPLHLYSQTLATLPIAYALDGFAVYGAIEPDGSPMATLDANHGHYGTDGVYHYHGTAEAPYMIGNMVGQVTEDATMQIIPQAAAQPTRPSLTPLNGAVITDCQPNTSTNGYTLTYTVNSQNFYVNYYWDEATTTCTYNFISPTDTTTSDYNGHLPCNVPMSVVNDFSTQNVISVFPNPATDRLSVKLPSSWSENTISQMSILTLDGRLVKQTNKYTSSLDIASLNPGMYILQVRKGKDVVVSKFVVEK